MYKGRKRALTKDKASELIKRHIAGESKALARAFGIDRMTVYRYLAREGKRKHTRRNGRRP